MEYRILGRTGIRVSEIGMGCEGLAGKSPEQVKELVDIMEEGGELTRRVAFDELIDNSFAQKAVETVKAE